jgi:DNA-directed RNA polymerase subunit RPC12/RpoP
MNDRSEIKWAPRVSLYKIKAFYLKESQGLLDDELLDEVGYGIFFRRESILEYTEALVGRVKCKRCAKSGAGTIIERISKKTTEMIRCPVCGWRVRWRVYLNQSKKTKGQLKAGHAYEAFQRYVVTFPKRRDRKEKIIAIDRLIHEFHWSLRAAGKKPEAMRTASVNLCSGSATQVLDMLDELAYSQDSKPELRETRDW